MEATPHSLDDLPVGSGCVLATGVASWGSGAHLWLTRVEETHIELEVAATTGLRHVSADHGLWVTRQERSQLRALLDPGLFGLSISLRGPSLPPLPQLGPEARRVSLPLLTGCAWGAGPQSCLPQVYDRHSQTQVAFEIGATGSTVPSGPPPPGVLRNSS